MSQIKGKVIEILDNYRVVINKGSADGVKEGMKFYIFEYGKEIIDPFTKENLGRLEVLKGRAFVEHVQEKMATLKSMPKMKRKVIKSKLYYFLVPTLSPEEAITEEEEGEPVPLTDVKVGDYVKSIE